MNDLPKVAPGKPRFATDHAGTDDDCVLNVQAKQFITKSMTQLPKG